MDIRSRFFRAAPREDPVAAQIRSHVERLCSVGGDRHPGSASNRAATDYVSEVLSGLGLAVEQLSFDVPEWRRAEAHMDVGGRTFVAHPGPFSGPVKGSGPLVVVSRAEQLDDLDAHGAVLLLQGEIAQVQLTPRDYPWYSDAKHAAILDALERLQPLAIIAATSKNPAMTAAMSPFPLVDEPRFAVPSAYLTAGEGLELARHAGEPATVRIDSESVPSTGVQVVGRLGDAGAPRIIVAAHIDTKPDTPGALDNAGGVATILAVAGLLGTRDHHFAVEFVPFNGEDHATSAGEIAYLGAHPDLSDVRLMVNVDGAGIPGGPSAYSTYGLDDATTSLLDRCAAGNAAVMGGPTWPASDHMIFAMRGVPAVALTSGDIDAFFNDIAHTPSDTPDKVDEHVLAGTARFIAQVIARLPAE